MRIFFSSKFEIRNFTKRVRFKELSLLGLNVLYIPTLRFMGPATDLRQGTQRARVLMVAGQANIPPTDAPAHNALIKKLLLS